MQLVPPQAPKRRTGNDTWYAWGEGAAIALFAIAAHQWASLPEHVMTGLFLLAGQRLPRGRFSDRKRWELAKNTRTSEREIIKEEE